MDVDGTGDADHTGTPSCVAPSVGWLADASDCDDTEPLVNPQGTELCDGLDNDCDGATDVDALDAGSWYLDGDGDGFGAGPASAACSAPANYVSTVGDCDDSDALVSPDASELCDGLDNDCDGGVDVDADDAVLHHPDLDGDGDGDWSSSGFLACLPSPPDSSLTNGDCDDGDAGVHSTADELCDSLDNDCDGMVDEDAVDTQDWYLDGDGDGFGDATAAPTAACSAPPGSVADNTDCDDSAVNVNPGAPSDYANSVDDDCDGEVDEDGAALSHAQDIQPLWDVECLGACHESPMPSSGMDLVERIGQTRALSQLRRSTSPNVLSVNSGWAARRPGGEPTGSTRLANETGSPARNRSAPCLSS